MYFLSFDKPLSVTEAMKRCDIYYMSVHKIFKLFIREGLIQLCENGKEKKYFLTEKGKKIYNILIQLKEFIK